jgi:hypothetical protein
MREADRGNNPEQTDRTPLPERKLPPENTTPRIRIKPRRGPDGPYLPDPMRPFDRPIGPIREMLPAEKAMEDLARGVESPLTGSELLNQGLKQINKSGVPTPQALATKINVQSPFL